MFEGLAKTHVLAFLLGIITDLWAETTGQIFLISIVTYSISYIIYSGYLSWFYRGYGSTLLSQHGFSAVDFLGLIPNVYILIFKSFWPLIRAAFGYLKILLLHLVLPIGVFAILATIISSINFYIFKSNPFIEVTGRILFFIGVGTGISPLREKKLLFWISIIVSYVGVLFLLLSLPHVANNADMGSFQGKAFSISNELLIIIILTYLPVAPFLIGMELAAVAVKEKLLSRVEKLDLKNSLEITGTIRESKTVSDKYSYKPRKEKPIYLVSSFSKNTILYIPEEGTDEISGKLVILTNEIILSMELESSNSGALEGEKNG